MQAAQRVVAHAARERYARRGHLLADHMRKMKKAYANGTRPKIAEHVLDKVKKHNEDHAMYQKDDRSKTKCV